MRHTQRMIGLGVGVLLAGGALSALPALASASSSCTYDPATKQVTATNDTAAGHALTLNRTYSGGSIYVNDGVYNRMCKSPDGRSATVTNTDKIIVKAAIPAAFQSTVIEEGDGGFAPGATAESTGKSEIEMVVLTGSGDDHLTVNGSYGRDTVRVHRATGSLSLGPEIDLNWDGDYDLNMTSAALVKVFGRGGDDWIDGSGSDTFKLELHGGGNNDVLFGGGKSDALYGDEGDDDFVAKDGVADWVDGGTGFDWADLDNVDVTANLEYIKPNN